MDFWELVIEFDAGGEPITGTFPDLDDCHKVIRKYNSVRQITMVGRNFTNPDRL